ncbi:MAG: nucleotidyltransferase domain-containing protein [Phycisphaerae bacterium]
MTGMVAMRDIRKLGRRIGEEFKPIRVILFGSHARGEATPDSDVDLLVVMRFKGHPLDKAGKILVRVHPGTFAIDLLVRSPAMIAKRIRMGDCFMKEVMDTGKVIYEAPDKRVDRQGRR